MCESDIAGLTTNTLYYYNEHRMFQHRNLALSATRRWVHSFNTMPNKMAASDQALMHEIDMLKYLLQLQVHIEVQSHTVYVATWIFDYYHVKGSLCKHGLG